MTVKKVADIVEEYDPPMSAREWVYVVAAVVILGGSVLLEVLR